MKKNGSSLAVIFALLATVGLACSGDRFGQNHSHAARTPGSAVEKLETVSIKGLRFVYFKIPAALNEKALIDIAQSLHESEPEAQLLLIDDDSGLEDYIGYTRFAGGQSDVQVELPREWADRHIIANVQKYANGRFVLCEGNGYREIAELK